MKRKCMIVFLAVISALHTTITAPYAAPGARPSDAEAASLSEYNIFSSCRLIVGTSDKALFRENDHIISSWQDNTWLLTYPSAGETKKAYAYFEQMADFVSVDAEVTAADKAEVAAADKAEVAAADGDEVETADGKSVKSSSDSSEEDTDALTELADAVDSAEPVKDTDKDSKDSKDDNSVVAVIDTGMPEDDNVTEYVSMIGDDTSDDNGHGTNTLSYLKEFNKDVQVISIKALGSDGKGDISAVYAGIEYALTREPDIILLPLYAVNTNNETDAAVTAAVKEAEEKGITVAGAAGNDGKDAKYYMPGCIDEAMIISACNDNGQRIASANYGNKVDYYVKAGSTSEASAKFAGYLSTLTKDGMEDALKSAAEKHDFLYAPEDVKRADGKSSDTSSDSTSTSSDSTTPDSSDDGNTAKAANTDGLEYYYLSGMTSRTSGRQIYNESDRTTITVHEGSYKDAVTAFQNYTGMKYSIDADKFTLANLSSFSSDDTHFHYSKTTPYVNGLWKASSNMKYVPGIYYDLSDDDIKDPSDSYYAEWPCAGDVTSAPDQSYQRSGYPELHGNSPTCTLIWKNIVTGSDGKSYDLKLTVTFAMITPSGLSWLKSALAGLTQDSSNLNMPGTSTPWFPSGAGTTSRANFTTILQDFPNYTDDAKGTSYEGTNADMYDKLCISPTFGYNIRPNFKFEVVEPSDNSKDAPKGIVNYGVYDLDTGAPNIGKNYQELWDENAKAGFDGYAESIYINKGVSDVYVNSDNQLMKAAINGTTYYGSSGTAITRNREFSRDTGTENTDAYEEWGTGLMFNGDSTGFSFFSATARCATAIIAEADIPQHSVISSTTGGGSGSISFKNSKQTVYDGGTLTYNVTPDKGSYLKNLTVDGKVVYSYDFDQNKVTANSVNRNTGNGFYATDTYTAAKTATPRTSSETSADKTYTYVFKQIYDNYSGNSDGSGTHLIVADFEKPTYTITTEKDPSNGGTITATQTGIGYGDNKTISYKANTGWYIDQVNIDDPTKNIKNNAADKYPSSYTFSNITADHAVYVHFRNWTDKPGLTLSKTVTYAYADGTTSIDGQTVKQGSELKYTITYKNTTIRSETVVITDAVPTNSTVTSIADNGTNSNGTITWNVGTVSPNTSGTVSFNVKVNSDIKAATINNVAHGTAALDNQIFRADSNQVSNNTVVHKITTSCEPAAGGTIGASEENIIPGSNRTVTYSANTGWYVDKVQVDGKDVDADTYYSKYAFTNISADHSVYVHFVNWTKAPGLTLTKKVAYTSDDSSIDGQIVKQGSQLRYTLSYANNSVRKETVTITDTLPAHTTFVSAANGGTYSNGKITWNVGSVAAGGKGTVSFVVKVNDNAGVESIPNKATAAVNISGSSAFSVTSNTVTNCTTTATKAVTNSSSQNINGNVVKTGDTLTYTISFRNPASATKTFTVTDKLPDGMTFISATAGGSNSDGTVKWTANVTAGGTFTGKVQVRPEQAPKTYTNTATVAVDRATLTTNEVKNYTVTPQKSAANVQGTDINGKSVAVGQKITYTVSVKNTTDVTKNFVLTDTLPVNTTYVSSTGSYSSGKVTWNATLAPNQELKGTVSVCLNTAGTYSNKCQATADNVTTDSDTVTSYVYRINVTKTASNTGKKLQGAGFVLKNNAGQYYHYANDLVTWVDKASATEYTTDSNGNVSFSGMEPGTYILVEVTAPNGYTINDQEPSATVSRGSYDQTISFADHPLQQLPKTGGSGIIIIVIAAVALAVISTIFRKKKGSKKDKPQEK